MKYYVYVYSRERERENHIQYLSFDDNNLQNNFEYKI